MSRKAIFSRLVAGARVRDNQSDVFRWFILNHDEFAEVLTGVSRPGWKAIAAELHAEGLTGKDGGPITATYARQAWWRAKRAYEQSRPSQPVTRLAPEPKPTPSTPNQPSSVIVTNDQENDNPYGFTVGIKPKDWTK